MFDYVSLITICSTLIGGILVGFSLIINVLNHVVEKIKRHEGSTAMEMTIKYHGYKQVSFKAVMLSVSFLCITILFSSVGFIDSTLSEKLITPIIISFSSSIMYLVSLPLSIVKILMITEPKVR